MCAYSMVADHYYDKWKDYQPKIWPTTYPPYQEDEISPMPMPPISIPVKKKKELTEEEVEDLRKMLERAKQYDKDNNEPDCELGEKKEKLRKLAKELGFELDFLD